MIRVWWVRDLESDNPIVAVTGVRIQRNIRHLRAHHTHMRTIHPLRNNWNVVHPLCVYVSVQDVHPLCFYVCVCRDQRKLGKRRL